MPSIFHPRLNRYVEVDEPTAQLFNQPFAGRTIFDPRTKRRVELSPEDALLFYPEIDEPEPVEGNVTLADYGRSVMAGGASVVSGLGWLVDRLDGEAGIGEAIMNVGNDAVEYWNEGLSDAAKREIAKEFVVKTDEGYEWGDASLATVGLFGAQSLLGTAAGAGMGAGATKVLQVFGNPAGRAVLTRAAQLGSKARPGTRAAAMAEQARKKLRFVDQVLGAAGFGIGEGTVGGAMTGVNVEQAVRNLPAERLLSSERGQQIYASTEGLMDEAKRLEYVRDTLAKEASSTAGWQAGVTTAVLGAPAGAYFGPLFSKVATGRPGSILKGAAGEAAQEFGQSGAEQLISNLRQADVGADVGAWENVLNAAIGGAAAGAPIGGVLATAGPTDRQVADSGGKRQKLTVDGVNYTRLAEMAAEAKRAGATNEEILPIMNEARKRGQLPAGLHAMRRLRDQKLKRQEAAQSPKERQRIAEPQERAKPEQPGVAPEQGRTVRPSSKPEEKESVTEGAVSTTEELDAVAQTAATSPENEFPEPTEAQIEAGNYKKPRVKIAHLPEIRIENPAGSKRRGKRPDGTEWEHELTVHYGYFTRTKGADDQEDGTPSEGVDVFVGPNATDENLPAFVIDQKNPDGSFDEHKVMVGFATAEEARQAYLAQYDEGWDGLGAITPMPAEELKAFINDDARTSRPVAYQPAEEGQPDGQEKEAQAAAEADVLEEEPREPIATRDIETDTAITPAGRDVPVRYAVVEASDLIASQTDEGKVNPDYPAELQPRDRARAVSQRQIQDIARNLNPRLLDRSPRASDGAPIIAADGVVESGNGRVLAIRRAYTEGNAEGYRQYLADQGYPVEGLNQPVLVRVREGELPMDERAAFTREANERDTLGLSATERAMADAAALPDALLELYRGGDVDKGANREFVRAFINRVVAKNEQAGMIAADGALSQEATRRIEGALLAKAYGDADLVATLIESADTNIRAIGGALMDVSASWAQMRAEAAAQRIDPVVDQTAQLLEAVRVVQRARREGRSVAELVGQQDLLSGQTVSRGAEAFLRLMFRNTQSWTQPAGRDKMASALTYYLDQAKRAQSGTDLLGESAPEPERVLSVARERQYGSEAQQPGLFAQPPRGAVERVPAPRVDREGPGTPGTAPAREPEAEGTGAQRAPAEAPVAPTRESLEAEIPYDTAYQAHSGTSHFPERRARQEQADYANQLLSDYDFLSGKVRNDAEGETFEREWARYHENFRRRFLAYLGSRQGLASSFIAGPANFPVRRMQKKNATVDRRLAELLELRRKALASIVKQLRPELAPTRTSDEDAADTWRAKLEKAEKRQEQMKAVNKAIRKGLPPSLRKKLKEARDGLPGDLTDAEQQALDTKIQELRDEFGLSETAARGVITPDFMGRIGFPGYALSNNNANIKRLKQQIAKAEAYQAERAEAGGSQEIEFDKGTIELDYDEGRIRVRIEKSDTETRQKLKAAGFRWSPRNVAWQRQLTENAKAATVRATGAVLEPTTEPTIDDLPEATIGDLGQDEAAEGNEALLSRRAADDQLQRAATLAERLRDATGSNLARKAAKEFVGRPLTNTETGQTATVSNITLGKMTSGSAVRNSDSPQAHMQAVANIDHLFEIATRSATRPDRDNSPAVTAWHEFDAPMPFEDDIVRVRLLVKELAQEGQGSRIYTLAAVEIGQEEARVNRGDSIDPADRTRLPTPPAGSDDRFAQLVEAVKGGLLSRAPAAMGFYSGLTRAAENLKQERGQPGQMLAMLKKQPGVKAEELEWTGLEEYLRGLQGPVTKQQIVEYLAANGVQIEELTLAGEPPDLTDPIDWGDGEIVDDDAMRARYDITVEGMHFTVHEDRDTDNVSVQRVDTGEFLKITAPPNQQSLLDAADAVNRYFEQFAEEDADVDGPAEHEAQTLPGGTNYREVLLTMPPHGRSDVRPTPTAAAPFMERWNELKAEHEEVNAAWMRARTQPDGDPREIDRLDLRRLEIENELDDLHQEMVDATLASGSRKLVPPMDSPHFPEQDNVLAHVRLTDRTGPNGGRILFVEELQSDWHQRGRREGYAERVPPVPKIAAVKDTGTMWMALDDEGFQIHYADSPIHVGKGTVSGRDDAIAYLDNYMRYLRVALERENPGRVPDAPFKGNAWAELAIKRVIRLAAEQGYDQVAWTTGEQQADRYDLSKKIDRIRLDDNTSGGVGLARMEGPFQQGILSAWDHDGTKVIDRFIDYQDQLADYIGKEAADKLLSQTPAQAKDAGIGVRRRELSGANLKVGGEGMKGFYDRTLPNVFKKVARKLDKAATVVPTEIRLDAPNEFAPAHALPITEAMRDAAMGGLPLFRKGKGTGLPAARVERQLRPAIEAVSPLLTVRVVQSVDELPRNAQRDDIEGAYFNRGAVYLVADNLSEARIEAVFRHEVFGHAAMERHADFPKWLQQIQNAKQLRGGIIAKLAAEVESRQGQLDATTEAKEIIALMAERGVESSLMDKIIAAFRRFFRSIGMLRDVSEAEIRSWLAKGERRFRAEAREAADAAMPTAANAGSVEPTQAYPDDTMDPALFSRAASPELEAAMDPPRSDTQLSRFLDEAIFRFQDKFNYLAKAQQAAARERGVEQLPEAEDVYLAELRYHGMAGAAIEDFQREHVEPLVEAISQSGLAVEDVDRYLHARHAPEANAQLKRINPEREDNEALSGMSDVEAAAVIDQFRREGKLASLEAIAMHVDAITKAQRDLMVESGLESAETIQTWEETYEHYVPLHREGFDKTVQPRGFSVPGRQKRRAGSTRSVVHILAQVIAQQEATIVRAHKNKVAQAMLEFATKNPNPALYEVDEVDYQPSFGRDGLVTHRPQRAFQYADNVVVAKVDGEDHTVAFNPRNHQASRIARAMKNLGTDHSGPILNTLTKVMRYLALVNTGANPEFIISNFPRDLQTAAYNLSDTEADKLKWTIIKDVGKAWRGIRAFQSEKSHPWAEHFDEFRKAGAQTGWLGIYANNLEHREKDLVKKLEDLSGNSSLLKIKAGMRAVIDFVEKENTAVENAIRLSAFVHSRRAGMSEGEAARLAKGLTVDFNKRGDYGQVMNALYLFYNASIQGSARIITAASRSPKVRKLIGATIVMAMFLDMLNRELGGDDEDDKARYDKIPDYVKERNLIIMRPGGGGDYFKIPLPWGYNVFHVMGQVMGEALTKRGFKATEGAARVADAVFSAFNPIGGEASIAQKLSPTLTDPIVQWAENKDWAGRPLRPEANPFDVDKPMSQQYWNSVREPSRWITEQLNELTGGSKVRPGAIDISPEWIDLVIDTFTGGAGRFVSDTLSTPVKALQGEDIESYEIPLLRKVYGQPGIGTLFRDYYKNADAVRITEKEAKHYMETRDRRALDALRRERAGEFQLIGMRRRTESALRKLRQRRNKLEASQLPDAVKRKQLDEIGRRMELLMNRFNRLYYERVER